jgi:SAM-dependent methyltransferase
MAWYEKFFGEDYMRFHLCGGERHDELAPGECDFVISALELRPGARVLDLCCGQGRHAVELTKRGFAVTGFDLSECLLGLARDRAAKAEVACEFIRGDMREIPWQNEFDAVLNLFTAFGYLETDEEDEKALRAVARCLRPGGSAFFDLWNRDRSARNLQYKDWYEHEGHIVLDQREWNWLTGRMDMTRKIVTPDGQRRELGFSLRAYTHPEIVEMLRRAGLEWERSYGDFEGSEYGEGSHRMAVVARKPEETS